MRDQPRKRTVRFRPHFPRADSYRIARELSTASCYAMTSPTGEGFCVAIQRSTRPRHAPPPIVVNRGATKDHDIGAVLRTAYESALEESIPPEMLDLLSKLK